MLGELFRYVVNQSSRVVSRYNDFVHEAILPNRIRIASQRRFQDDKIRFTVCIKCGTYDEPTGKEGLAHHLEHVLFSPELVQEFKNRNGGVNAATSVSNMCLEGYVDDNVENLKFLARTIGSFLLDDVQPGNVQREKRRILNERGMYHDTLKNVHNLVISKAFKNREHSNDILGKRQSISGLTTEDLNQFKRMYFTGENISIGISGVSDHDFLQELMKTELKDIPAKSSVALSNPEILPGDFRESDDKANQLYFGIHFPFSSPSQRDLMILRFARNYLNEKLQSQIMREKGLVYDIIVIMSLHAGRNGYFYVQGNCLPEDADKIIPEVAAILTAFSTNLDHQTLKLIKEEMLDELKNQKHLFFADHSVDDMAFGLMGLGCVMPVHEEEKLLNSIKMTEIQDFIKKLVSATPTITAYGNHTGLHSCAEFQQMLTAESGKLKNQPADEEKLGLTQT